MADVLPLPAYEPEGTQFHENGWVGVNPKAKGASISGPAPKYSSAEPVRSGLGGSHPSHKPQRKLTPEEMLAMAEQMRRHTEQQKAAAMQRGPAVQAPPDRPLPPLENAAPAWLQDYMAANGR